jgi:UDP-N-acetylmuramate dehydrogenase
VTGSTTIKNGETGACFPKNMSSGSVRSLTFQSPDFEELRDVEFLWDEPLAKHTTFRVGGPVKCLARPLTEEALLHLLNLLRDRGIPHITLGGGSNVLAPDVAWDILAVQLTRCCSGIMQGAAGSDGMVRVYAGAGGTNSRLLRYCVRNGLSGLEFLAGIPGTLGGASIMNAGARDGCLSDVLEGVDILTARGVRQRVEIAKLTTRYRHMGLPDGCTVLGVMVRLRQEESGAIQRKIRQIVHARKQTQPVGKPSAGCIFKNPDGHSAGALIDRAGLKGYRIGDAEVSEKHANWIVNLGNARAEDILRLIGHIEHTVFQLFGIRLEREVRVLA